MAEITKPNYQEIWASSGSVVAPDDSKIRQGWVEEQPASQHENYLQRRQDEAIKYLFQRGVAEWDAGEEYFRNKSVVLLNGKLYLALSNNTNKNPTTSTADWKDLVSLTVADISGLQTQLDSKASKTELTSGLTLKADKAVTVSAGNGLTGGGNLSGNISMSLGTPSNITASSTNSVTSESHSHSIDKASLTTAGVVKLNNTLTSTSTSEALTAAQGKVLFDLASQGGVGALQKANNLSDVANIATSRANLGIKSSALYDVVSHRFDSTDDRIPTTQWKGLNRTASYKTVNGVATRGFFLVAQVSIVGGFSGLRGTFLLSGRAGTASGGHSNTDFATITVTSGNIATGAQNLLVTSTYTKQDVPFEVWVAKITDTIYNIYCTAWPYSGFDVFYSGGLSLSQIPEQVLPEHAWIENMPSVAYKARMVGLWSDLTFDPNTKANTSSLGTAAFKNVGTNAGDVVMDGGYGIGRASNHLSNFADVSIPNGFYNWSPSSTNRPSGIPEYGVAIVSGMVMGGTANHRARWLFSLNSEQVWFQRSVNMAAWTAPQEIYHTGNLPTTATRWPTWNEVTSKPTTFAPSSHTHAWSQITGAPATATRWPTWGEVTGKPSSFDRTAYAGATYALYSSGKALSSGNEYQNYRFIVSSNAGYNGDASLLGSKFLIPFSGSVRIKFESYSADVTTIRVKRGSTVVGTFNALKNSTRTYSLDVTVAAGDEISFDSRYYEGRAGSRHFNWLQFTTDRYAPAPILVGDIK